MAKILEITLKHATFVEDLETGKLCRTEKVVDTSEDCPGLKEDRDCLLLFFILCRRPTVQIVQVTPPHNTIRINFTIADLDEWMCQPPRTDFFWFLGIFSRHRQ